MKPQDQEQERRDDIEQIMVRSAIDYRVYSTRNDLVLSAIVEAVADTVDREKWRTVFNVKVRRNSYDFQSEARVTKWDGSRWQYVHHLPYCDMKAQECSVPTTYTAGQPVDATDEILLREDAITLLRYAETITRCEIVDKIR